MAEFWGLVLQPNKKYRLENTNYSINITNAAVDTTCADDEFVHVLICYNGTNFLLCTLNRMSMHQVPLNVQIPRGIAVEMFCNGGSHVHLIGKLMKDKTTNRDSFLSDKDDDNKDDDDKENNNNNFKSDNDKDNNDKGDNDKGDDYTIGYYSINDSVLIYCNDNNDNNDNGNKTTNSESNCENEQYMEVCNTQHEDDDGKEDKNTDSEENYDNEADVNSDDDDEKEDKNTDSEENYDNEADVNSDDDDEKEDKNTDSEENYDNEAYVNSDDNDEKEDKNTDSEENYENEADGNSDDDDNGYDNKESNSKYKDDQHIEVSSTQIDNTDNDDEEDQNKDEKDEHEAVMPRKSRAVPNEEHLHYRKRLSWHDLDEDENETKDENDDEDGKKNVEHCTYKKPKKLKKRKRRASFSSKYDNITMKKKKYAIVEPLGSSHKTYKIRVKRQK